MRHFADERRIICRSAAVYYLVQATMSMSGRKPNANVGTPPLAEQMLALLTSEELSDLVEDSGADSLFAIDPNLPMLVLSHAFSLRQPSAELIARTNLLPTVTPLP